MADRPVVLIYGGGGGKIGMHWHYLGVIVDLMRIIITLEAVVWKH